MFSSVVPNGGLDCIGILLLAYIHPKGLVKAHFLRVNNEPSHKEFVPRERTRQSAAACWLREYFSLDPSPSSKHEKLCLVFIALVGAKPDDSTAEGDQH